MRKILLVNHSKKQCGVYQYGLNVYLTCKPSSKYEFVYEECQSAVHLDQFVNKHKPSAVIFNHYPITMNWLRPQISKKYGIPSLGTYHEITQEKADKLNPDLFDIYLCLDPTLKETKPFIKSLGRIVPNFKEESPLPEMPTIGSFGFGVLNQGYLEVIDQVQEEFYEAHIRFHMPKNDVVDPSGKSLCLKTANLCRERIKKPGIKLTITHDFLSKLDLMRWLQGNTINAFFRHKIKSGGISSALDFALAVNRPIIITKCDMFKHLYDAAPSILIEDLGSITEAINNGICPLKPYQEKWSESVFLTRIEDILDEVI